MNSTFSLDEAQRLVESSKPSASRSLLTTATVVLAVAATLVVGLSGDRLAYPQWVSVLLPWALVLGLLCFSWSAGLRRKRTLRQLDRAVEAAEWNDWPRVGVLTRALLQSPLRPPPARGQALLLLAASAERAGVYEVSEHLFEAVRGEPRTDPLQRGQATLGLAGTKLRSEQLTDAVRLLDSLRNMEWPPGIRAGIELVRLFQEVWMGHNENAAASMALRRPLFRRHLSTRAAHGYALFAAALDALGRREDAAALWRDATMLVEPQGLIERYELLRGLAARYPAMERPL